MYVCMYILYIYIYIDLSAENDGMKQRVAWHARVTNNSAKNIEKKVRAKTDTLYGRSNYMIVVLAMLVNRYTLTGILNKGYLAILVKITYENMSIF